MDGKKRMLIVEDDTDLLKMYETIFRNSEFEIDTASDIPSAQKLVKETLYKIILLDLMTPQGDHLPTIRLARSKENPNLKTPIIVLTNLDAGTKTKEALKYGANDCLFKANFTPKSLFTEVLRLLSVYNNI